VRPRNLVAGTALTAALALVALPGFVDSRSPSRDWPIDPAAFQQVSTASGGGSSLTIDLPDDALRSAGALTADSRLVERGKGTKIPVTKPRFNVPTSSAGYDIKPPKYKVTGTATFYDNGTTAMRLPRGTVIRICGPTGRCIDRVVNDYGPLAGTDRIIDLYRPDFFAICGCPSWSGLVKVTVSVY
jgi:hypothetical protein